MSAEDRLRQILLAEAEDLVPDGDGLRRIEQRLSERRSLRAKLIPAVALAGVVVASAGAITLSRNGKASLDTPPAHQPGASALPTPSSSLPTSAVTTSANGVPVWPFTSDLQVAEWTANKSSRPWASDPVAVTQHLLDDYLKLRGRATASIGNEAGAAVVEVSNGSLPVSQVRLVRVGQERNGPWSVTGAVSDNLVLTQPTDGNDVRSPISVAGTATDPDTSVHLRLLTNRVLGEGYAMAGRDEPWTHSLPYSGNDWTVGALVANTVDGKGDLHALTITAVRQSGAITPGPPAAGIIFLAVDDKHRVVTVDSLAGKQLRQLSYPPNGAVDSDPDRGGEDGVVWVRTLPDGCTSSIIRAGLVRGPAGVTVDAKPVHRVLPSLSAGGRSLAWVEQPCTGGESTIFVRGPDATFWTTATTSDVVKDLDVRDDGHALVWTDHGVYLVPPGTTALTTRVQLFGEPGCELQGPAWSDQTAFAWQKCDNTWQPVLWDASGHGQAGNVRDVPADVSHTSFTDGQMLVALVDRRLGFMSEGHYVDVPNANRWSTPDW